MPLGLGGTFFFTLTAGDIVGESVFTIALYRDWEPEFILDTYDIPIHII